MFCFRAAKYRLTTSIDSSATGDIEYGQLPDSSTPQDPLGLRDDPSLNFGETYSAVGGRVNKGCNVKNAENGHLYGCGMSVETPIGINMGVGADVMNDGTVKFGIGGGDGGGQGFGMGCEVGADGSLRCGKGSSLGGQQGFASAGDVTTQAVGNQAATLAHLASLEGQHAHVDEEYKEGTLHLALDSQDFHAVIMGQTIYVPPDLAAEQEEYYLRLREAERSPRSGQKGKGPTVAGTERSLQAVETPAGLAVIVPEGQEVPDKDKPVVVERAQPATPTSPSAAAVANVAATAGTNTDLNKPNPLQNSPAILNPSGPDLSAPPRLHIFQGKVPGNVEQVEGTMLLPPVLNAQLWRVAGAEVMVNCSQALLTYVGNPFPVSYGNDGIGRVTPMVSGIKEADQALLNTLYFFDVTLTLAAPENLPSIPLGGEIRVNFQGQETVGDSIMAEVQDEAVARTYPGAGEKFVFDTSFVKVGALDDLTPVQQMRYVHLDLRQAVPVMAVDVRPKLFVHNVGMVIRRVPPTPAEVASDADYMGLQRYPAVNKLIATEGESRRGANAPAYFLPHSTVHGKETMQVVESKKREVEMAAQEVASVGSPLSSRLSSSSPASSETGMGTRRGLRRA